MSKILVRFDDICPTMNWEQFNIACDLMDRYGVKPLIGVIPDNKDSDLKNNNENQNFWSFLRLLQNKGYTIAMHGVNHVFCSQYKGIVTNRVGSEFAGRSLGEQIEILNIGKKILEQNGIHTNIFFAPAHSYDWNTLKALRQCGFKYMSDGKSAKPYMKDSILCIPCRSHGCPSIKNNNFYTAIFHAHEWTRVDKKCDFELFCNLLVNHHKEIVTFDEYAKAPIGNFLIQRINETIYLKWIYGIKPILSKVYHKIRKYLN